MVLVLIFCLAQFRYLCGASIETELEHIGSAAKPLPEEDWSVLTEESFVSEPEYAQLQRSKKIKSDQQRIDERQSKISSESIVLTDDTAHDLDAGIEYYKQEPKRRTRFQQSRAALNELIRTQNNYIRAYINRDYLTKLKKIDPQYAQELFLTLQRTESPYVEQYSLDNLNGYFADKQNQLLDATTKMRAAWNTLIQLHDPIMLLKPNAKNMEKFMNIDVLNRRIRMELHPG